MPRLLAALLIFVLAACSGAPSRTENSAAPASSPPPSSAQQTAAQQTTQQTAAPAQTAAGSSAPAALAAGQLPTSCAQVTIANKLAALPATGTPTESFTDPAKAMPLPTTEAEAQREDRTWPGLSCLWAGPSERETMIMVWPDSSPFFTKRQTTTCLPTYGKGDRVSLGALTGWHCPTTNESPGEWVSYTHNGRVVSIQAISAPNGQSPYKDALVAYATALAATI